MGREGDCVTEGTEAEGRLSGQVQGVAGVS
jgi:hypothetical protein